MAMHPTTLVTHGDLHAEIDTDLAPMVLEMCRAGIDTQGSCQDAGDSLRELVTQIPGVTARARNTLGRAYVQFRDPTPLCLFFGALANAGPRSGIYERMTHWAALDAWQVTLSVVDELADDDDPDWAKPSVFYPSTFHLDFPASDIEEMTRRMRAHNDGLGVAGDEPTWPTITLPEGSSAT